MSGRAQTRLGSHQAQGKDAVSAKQVVPVERIELPTFGLQNRCSTAELNRRIDGIGRSNIRLVGKGPEPQIRPTQPKTHEIRRPLGRLFPPGGSGEPAGRDAAVRRCGGTRYRAGRAHPQLGLAANGALAMAAATDSVVKVPIAEFSKGV